MSQGEEAGMFGMRCEECGEVRWSILGRGQEKPVECPACGAEMIDERRHPGTRSTAREERRDAVPTADPA
jgi:uncharacterized paraquat-inducible protein A